MNSLTLEQRIDRLESRAAIAELGSAYAVACDERDMDRLRSVFTQDAVVRSVNGLMNASGIEAIMDMFVTMFQIRGPAYHWTHDRFVWFSDSDANRATGQVLAHAETTLEGVPSLAALRYDDVYARRDGAWKFAERTLSFLYYFPMKDYLERMPSTERFYEKTGYRSADFPESLATWQEFYGTAKTVG
jgi:ketosteroid isomerase-like protein